MALLHDKKIRFAPDERGAAAATAEDQDAEPKGPRMFKVGDEEVPEEELIRGYKGTKETTKRFQEVSEREGRARAAEERAQRLLQDAEDRERKLNAARDEMVFKRDEGEKPAPRPRLKDRLKGFELVTDDDAGEKIGAMVDEEWESREAEMKAGHEREMAQLRAEIKAGLEAVKAEATSASSKEVAADRVRRRNAEVFEQVLEDEFSAVKLSKDERAAVEKKARQKIGQDYGAWDSVAGAWAYNDEAVKDAMWSTPEVREKLLKAQAAESRGEGLRARERGERATESTPGRTNRPGSTDPDQQLLQKHQDVSEALKFGRISQERAEKAFSFAEKKRLLQLRNDARSRERAESN